MIYLGALILVAVVLAFVIVIIRLDSAVQDHWRQTQNEIRELKQSHEDLYNRFRILSQAQQNARERVQPQQSMSAQQPSTPLPPRQMFRDLVELTHRMRRSSADSPDTPAPNAQRPQPAPEPMTDWERLTSEDDLDA
jgi:protein subunit release factor B